MIIGVYTGSFEGGVRFYRLTPDVPRTFLYVSMFALLVLIASFSLSWLSLWLDRSSDRSAVSCEQLYDSDSIPGLTSRNSRSSHVQLY